MYLIIVKWAKAVEARHGRTLQAGLLLLHALNNKLGLNYVDIIRFKLKDFLQL